MLPIPLYEGRYCISATGQIYSLLTEKWLKLQTDKDGYSKVCLYSGGRCTAKTFRVCRLVASTYLIPQIDKPFVNHLDGNKQNDSIENLEWVSAKENALHAWSLGLCKAYDRSLNYNRDGIIKANQQRKKWFGTHKEYCKEYYKNNKKGGL